MNLLFANSGPFYKIMDLLVERGARPNPPGYVPVHVRPMLPMGMTMLITKIIMTKMNLLLPVNSSQGIPLSGLVTVSRTGVTYYPWPRRMSLILIKNLHVHYSL